MTHLALLGTRPLSRRCLAILDKSPDVTVEAVVTYGPDHEGWWEGSLYEYARELGYPIVAEKELFEYDLDYLISTQYHNILKGDLLAHPTHGGLNLHLAELPRYRGSNPFAHALLNARDDDYWKYGVTLHFMSEAVDEGDIVARRFIDIGEHDTAKTLYNRGEDAAVDLFSEMTPDIASGAVNEMRTPQSEFEGPSYYYTSDSLDEKFEVDLSDLTDERKADELYDHIRALEFPPFDPAHVSLGGRDVYLTTSTFEELLDEQL